DSSAYWCGGAALWRTPAEGECSDSIDNDLDGDVDADDDSCDNEGPNEGGDLGTPGAPNPQCDLDNDGDGFRPPLDCDDTNAAIYPGQLELPDNSKDDNCDGQTDEVIPPTQAVIITEIMYDPYPPSDNDGEYLELYNTTAEAIDLSGWSITDNANTLTVVGELILPANGYVVFVRTLDTEAN
ncbi:MAG: lamin tail domain-containing protein, partial [Myxococcales bacterium]|nr:lamin tail domain-containing protein [Myxococcales bacterium]